MKLLETKEEFQERIMDLSIEIFELKKFKKIALQYAQKFVRKVESGRARSKETYADMKKLLMKA